MPSNTTLRRTTTEECNRTFGLQPTILFRTVFSLLLFVLLLIPVTGTPAADKSRQRYVSLQEVAQSRLLTVDDWEYWMEAWSPFGSTTTTTETEGNHSGVRFVQRPFSGNVYLIPSDHDNDGTSGEWVELGVASILSKAENRMIAGYLATVADRLRSFASLDGGVQCGYRSADGSYDWSLWTPNEPLHFADGCDDVYYGRNCVKYTIGLVPVRDCPPGLHPLCCVCYFLSRGESFSLTQRKTLAELHSDEIVWDGTRTVNGYFTNFSSRTLQHWKHSQCRPLLSQPLEFAGDPPSLVFAVDAQGAWALTTSLELFTLQLRYLPVRKERTTRAVLETVFSPSVAPSHMESARGRGSGEGPVIHNLGGAGQSSKAKLAYGSIPPIIPVIVCILLLAVLVIFLAVGFAQLVRAPTRRIHQIEKTVKDPRFAEVASSFSVLQRTTPPGGFSLFPSQDHTVPVEPLSAIEESASLPLDDMEDSTKAMRTSLDSEDVLVEGRQSSTEESKKKEESTKTSDTSLGLSSELATKTVVPPAPLHSSEAGTVPPPVALETTESVAVPRRQRRTRGRQDVSSFAPSESDFTTSDFPFPAIPSKPSTGTSATPAPTSTAPAAAVTPPPKPTTTTTSTIEAAPEPAAPRRRSRSTTNVNSRGSSSAVTSAAALPDLSAAIATLTEAAIFAVPSTSGRRSRKRESVQQQQRNGNAGEKGGHLSLRRQRDLQQQEEENRPVVMPYDNSFRPPLEPTLPSAIRPSRYRRTFSYDASKSTETNNGENNNNGENKDSSSHPNPNNPYNYDRPNGYLSFNPNAFIAGLSEENLRLHEANTSPSAEDGDGIRLVPRRASKASSSSSRRSNIKWQLDDLEV